jgi:hypothetical protein
MFFPEFVERCVGRRVAPLPEQLDKILPLFVRPQVVEDGFFILRNDVEDFLVEPLLVFLLDFWSRRFFFLLRRFLLLFLLALL